MPSGVQVKLHFLPPKTSATQTRKSKHQLELEDQEAKAHAASISHHRAGRRGVQGHRGQNPTHAPLAEVSTYSRQLLPVREGDLALQTKQKQRDWDSQGLAWIKTGPLDPFLRLPNDLNIRDRNTLFFYLDTIPRAVHGVKQNPVFCPVRECTIVNIANSHLSLQWIILFAEMMTGASKTAIYARRAAIYAGTKKMLQTKADFLLDEALLHLLVATIAETRLGNLELANIHFTGLLQVLKLRNGLRTFQEISRCLGFSMLHAFVVGQVPLFHTREELLDALGRMRLPRARKPVPLLIRRYFEASSFTGAHVGNLHMLNMVMAEEPEGYMDRLVYNITGSGDKLTPVGITFMIAQSAAEVGVWYGPNPLVRSWETIEFVRLLAYTIVSKEATVRALSSCLTGERCFDFDLGDLKAEILDIGIWLRALGE